jgi:hypothetical protein
MKLYCSCISEICALELDVGLCRGYFSKWFFNTSTGECEKFVYGGCRGNGNNFDSPERCEEICGPVKGIFFNYKC